MHMAFPARNGATSTRYHFPQLGENGLCGKSIKPHRVGSQERCGQDRDGDRHLYYRCRKLRSCEFQSWSIEQRLDHESEAHR